MRKTDWTKYYHDNTPTSISSFTRKFTEINLIDLMIKFGVKNPVICELGGANSCFFSGIREALKDKMYVVVDSNPYGLDLFRRRGDKNILAIDNNLIETVSCSIMADIVFSVGLVEHFDNKGTSTVISNHFKYLRPGGICIITFPTPTLLYRILRGAITFAGKWAFHDERPLGMDEVAKEVGKHADVISTHVNYGCLLTQGVVVARYHGGS